MNERSEAWLKERYYLEGENWERLCKRVAWVHATSDKEAREFYNMMQTMKALPSSPILMNSGITMDSKGNIGNGYLSACNLVPLNDDLSEIFDSLKTAAMIQKHGGGVGINFTKLRGKGEKIGTTGGESSGVIAFLNIFNAVSNGIRQGGKRRGANMGVLAAWHPDIEDWIKAKHVPKTLEAFNISVGVPDELFEKVNMNEAFELKDPRNDEVVGEYNAKAMEHMIARQIWYNGEPGVLFWDTIQRSNGTPWLGNLQGLNPCVAGDTLVAVADGRNYVSIEELVKIGEDVLVYSFNGERIVVAKGILPRKTKSNVDIFEVKLDDGSVIKATEDHKFMLRDGSYVVGKDLKSKDSLMPFNRWKYSPKGKKTKYWAIGTNEKNRRWFSEHRMIAEFLGKGDLIPHHKNYDGQDNSILNLEFLTKEEHDKIHDISGDNNPMRFWWNGLSEEEKEKHRKKMSESQSGEKNGMFGKKQGESTKKKISESQKERLKDCWIDIDCPFCGESFEITKGQYKAREKNNKYGVFCSISCAQKYRWSLHNHKVVSITYVGKEDVYNLTVPSHHNYAIVTDSEAKTKRRKFVKHSGIIIANCGEVPLYNYESCVLGSVNLYEHLVVTNGSLELDLDGVAETTKSMVVFLNRVLDGNEYPLLEMREAAQKTRKIGVGIMGFADVLYRLGITYGDTQCMLLIDRIMTTMSETAKETSLMLANISGPYPAHQEGAPELRNASLLAIAPTGSIARIADVSYGIEPAFDLIYSVQREDVGMEVILDRAMEDVLEGRDDREHIINELFNGVDARELLGLHWVKATDVTPLEHINVLAAFQKQVDQSISKTINLPNDTTVEDIRHYIRYAHKHGIKGITLYREGCYRDAFLTDPECPKCKSNLQQIDGCTRCSDPQCDWELCSLS